MAIPRSVPGIIYGLLHYGRVPSEQLGGTGTTTSYKVVTNAGTAWLYGCAAVNCALLGIGERTGNCPLEAMAIEYAGLRGTTDGMDLTAITEIAEFFERELGYDIPPRTPFVGRNFQRHPRGHPRRRPAQGRGDLQHLRHRPHPQPPGHRGGGLPRAWRASPTG